MPVLNETKIAELTEDERPPSKAEKPARSPEAPKLRTTIRKTAEQTPS